METIEKNNIKNLDIKHNDLPILIIFKNSKGRQKKFILKSTSQGEKLVLNKKEY